ncbi:Leucine-rich repeat-containing protein 63, partial [Entomortierella chlamydospora]
MGSTVSREHAKLPFGYTHAHREDHTCTATASTSLASRRRQRLAHRLLLIKSSDSASITPLQTRRFRLTEDGGIVPTIGESAGIGFPSAPVLSQWSIEDADSEDADSEDAEIVSLSSILNQGPEFELQWHAVGQDYDEGFYSSNGINAIASGSGTRTTVISDAGQDYDSFVCHSRSNTPGSIDHSTCPRSPLEPPLQHPQSKTDRETETDPYVLSGLGSTSSATVNRDVTLEIVEGLEIEKAQDYTIITASAVAATALQLSSPTQSDDFKHNTPAGSNSISSGSGSSSGQDEETQKNDTYLERPRVYPTQHLQKYSFKAIRQDLTDSDEETDEEETLASDRCKMDIISALGIAEAPKDSQESIPFNFFNEEPTFHSIPDQFRPHMTTRRYTTDGSSRGHGTWMDHDYNGGAVHLPQGFFGTQEHRFVDTGDGSDEESDPDGDEGDGDEYLRTKRFYRRKGVGASIPGVSTATLGSNGHSLFNYPATISADEDVSHFSPIPFSELPSLTSIKLCSYGIVKLSSNIRLLTSATCFQVVPIEIGFLRNLTLLDLSRNSLTSLPDSIQFLTKLTDLKLSFNYIEFLPSTIGELTKLTSLCADNNRLTKIPSQIGQLKNLAILDLDENPIRALPVEIGQLRYLKRLRLDGCPLVKEFVHSPLNSPPTLLELAARVIVRHRVNVPRLLPSHLKTYLKTSQQCSFCSGPYFESSFKRGKMIERDDTVIPLEYTLCVPHWNTDMERIKLMFGPRPATSPPPPPPKVNHASSTNSSNSGAKKHTKSASTSKLTSLSNDLTPASSTMLPMVDQSSGSSTPLNWTGSASTLINSDDLLAETPSS